MSSFPDAVSGQALLEAGLAAIKQGHYPQAIEQLTQYLSGTPADPSRAKMGLVVAYSRWAVQSAEAAEYRDRAIALCEELRQSPNPKQQALAQRTLAELQSTTDTGFVPLEFSQSRPRAVFSASKPSDSSAASDSIQYSSNNLSSDLSNDSPSDSLNNSLSDSQSDSPRNPAPVATALSSDRPTRWQALPRLNPSLLQWASLGTGVSLYGLIYLVYALLTAVPNAWLAFNTRFLGGRGTISTAEVSHWAIALPLLLLWFTSPWLLDSILKGLYGLRSLQPSTLARSSPETYRLLQRASQRRLGLLPSAVPLLFTYGSLPRFARIVVSQGLLDQLSDEEIAALFAGELGHLTNRTFSLLSLMAIVMQLPYSLYSLSAIASDRLFQSAQAGMVQNRTIAILLKIAAIVFHLVAAASYGLFWYLRGAGFWLSRQRIRYSDRYACNLTGNPNALARALWKIAIATRQHIQTQGKTDALLEGWELMTPLGYRTALNASDAELLHWDLLNPDAARLAWSNSHPLFGERLARLSHWAVQWQTQPEMTWPDAKPRFGSIAYFAPWLGAAIGFAIALLLWIAAHLLFRVGSNGLNWLASDYKLFIAFTLLGWGMGTLLRFNRLFPEILNLDARQAEATATLPELLIQPRTVPLNSQPVRLVGTLLGRSGSSNSLAQDLILSTPTGLIRLDYCSQLGKVGNLVPQSTRPADLIGQSVTVVGWFRRTATPWVDVDVIRSDRGRLTRAGHPVWSTVIAIVTLAFGILAIL
jgi:Zn-dependent protease with chaperone function